MTVQQPRSLFNTISVSALVPSFTSALLSTSALISATAFVGIGTSVAEPANCTPPAANGAYITCVGNAMNASNQFTGSGITVEVISTFVTDTSTRTAASSRSNAGISITGATGTIRSSGTITTGEVDEGGGTHGQHHGLFIIGGAGDATIENQGGGSITTKDKESNGIFVSATTGITSGINRGTILTIGNESSAVESRNVAAASATNFGSIETRGVNSHGAYAYSQADAALARNETGGTVTLTADRSGAVFADGATSGTATNSGTINLSGSGAVGGVVAMARATAGTSQATNNGTINMTGPDAPTYNGYADVAIAALGGTATALNAAGAVINDTGSQQGSIGVVASAIPFNLFVPSMMAVPFNGNNVTATNAGSILLTGNGGRGVFANSIGGTASATNASTGTITITGDRSSGLQLNGATVVATNNGTISITGDHSVGIEAVSSSPDTTTIVNSGTITVTAATSNEATSTKGLWGIGPTVNITNQAGGTVTAYNAIEAWSGGVTTIVNDGTLNGRVLLGHIKLTNPMSTADVTNRGTINGEINGHDQYNATIRNIGGTVGNGESAIFTGLGNNQVIISGTGNVIRGAITDRDANPADMASLFFDHTDTLVLDDGDMHGAAIVAFDQIAFRSGTTRFSGTATRVTSPNAALTIGGGATVTTDLATFTLDPQTVAVSGTPSNPGVLHIPAGSTITSTGAFTFNSGGRLGIGVAGDANAGRLTAQSVTLNSGSEVFADVTRGINLTPGNAIQIVGTTAGVTDNGTSVVDNSTLFDFRGEVRASNDYYLVVEQVLTAAQATFNKGGRENARDIASALDKFITNAPTNNPIVTYLAQFPVAEQEQKLFELVRDTLPSESGASGSSTVVSTDMVLDLIMDRLSGGGFVVVDSGERRSGVAAGDQVLGGAGNWALWGRAGASFAEFTPSGVNGFDSDTYAVSLGLDGDVVPDVRVGIAGFYSDTKVDETGSTANSNQDIEGYGVLLYGSYRPEAFYANATLGYGVNRYDSRRRALGGVNSASYDGSQFMSRLEIGKVFTDGKWDVSPHVGMRLNIVSIDGYTETGPLPTTVSGQNLLSARGVLGLSGRYTHVEEDGRKIIPEAYIRGIQEFADPNEAITGTVIGGGTFVSRSAERDKFAYGIGAGLTYEMDESLSLRFLYDGELQEDYQEHSLTAAVRYQF